MGTLKTSSVPALDKGLSILELLARSTRGLTLGEVSRQLRMPKSTAHSLLLTLERRGYLHRSQRSGRYLFDLKLLSLSNMALNGLKFREQAKPFLRALSESTRLTVHMAVAEHDEVVLIEKLDPPGGSRVATWIGRRMDAHCTGIGKALLAYLPDSELDRLIREKGLPRHNENTIASARRLKTEMERILAAGYALDDEEDEVGYRCVAVPVFDRAGRAIAGISVVGTTDQITSDNVLPLAERVKQTGAKISEFIALDPAGEP